MSINIHEVKKVLRCLLIATPGGMTVRALERNYRETEGQEIPYLHLSFNNVIEFLNSIPDTLCLSIRCGQQIVTPVNSTDSSHVMKLVKGQKKLQRRSHRKPPLVERFSEIKPKTHSQFYGCQQINNIQTHAIHACQSNNTTEPFMSDKREKHNGIWIAPNESANLFVPDLIEADFNSENTSETDTISSNSSLNVKPKNDTHTHLQRTDFTDNAKCNTVNPLKNTVTRMLPSECSRRNRNLSVLACSAANYISIDEQIDDGNGALPKMTHYEFMTLLDDGEFILTNKDPFANISLSQYGNYAEGSTIKIIVSDAQSPYKFWFQMEHTICELELLMEALKFYDENISNEDLRLPLHLIRPGQICVALYEKQWHRARIVDVYEDDAVKVFYLDYGTVEEVYAEDIRLMRNDFSELFPQAFRGCLDNIRPAAGLWTREATQQFRKAVANIKVYAKLTGIDTEEKTFYMNITDPTKAHDININDILIDNAHAIHEKIPMTRMKRRHYNERYPTFDMLENGEYPSFTEIGHFLSQGYNFAIYEQSIIIPNMIGYSTEI